VLVARWRLGVGTIAAWLQRLTLLTVICASVATWFRFLLATIGGADSYGYVSASRLLSTGHLVAPAPIAQWLSAANRLAIASPLGWAPAPDGSGIVPTYPIGVSTLMAIFSLIGGPSAVFFVSPVAAAVTLYLVYRLACEWFDAETALFAAAIVAWNPLFITYAKQPMSDMTATMWVMLALLLAVRTSSASAFVAGLAAGAAVITRPALLVAAAFIPLAAYRGHGRRARFLISASGLAIGVKVMTNLTLDYLFGK
jgi:asparagine N-glycosylation enzyme membrane subunit Stt3